MKKRLLNILVISCIFLSLGFWYLFDSVFSKAEPIERLEVEDIVSVLLSCNTPEGTIQMSNQYHEDLIEHISEAKPTRRQSVNDYPTVRDYYGVEVQTTGKQYRYFVYEEGTQVYIEIPYTGIYKSNNKLLDLVLTYFTEG